jgi:hypothetical protein
MRFEKYIQIVGRGLRNRIEPPIIDDGWWSRVAMSQKPCFTIAGTEVYQSYDGGNIRRGSFYVRLKSGAIVAENSTYNGAVAYARWASCKENEDEA